MKRMSVEQVRGELDSNISIMEMEIETMPEGQRKDLSLRLLRIAKQNTSFIMNMARRQQSVERQLAEQLSLRRQVGRLVFKATKPMKETA